MIKRFSCSVLNAFFICHWKFWSKLCIEPFIFSYSNKYKFSIQFHKYSIRISIGGFLYERIFGHLLRVRWNSPEKSPFPYKSTIFCTKFSISNEITLLPSGFYALITFSRFIHCLELRTSTKFTSFRWKTHNNSGKSNQPTENHNKNEYSHAPSFYCKLCLRCCSIAWTHNHKNTKKSKISKQK